MQIRTSHEENSVDAEFPVMFQHFLGLVKKYLCLVASGGTLLPLDFFGPEEDLGFRDE